MERNLLPHMPRESREVSANIADGEMLVSSFEVWKLEAALARANDATVADEKVKAVAIAVQLVCTVDGAPFRE